MRQSREIIGWSVVFVLASLGFMVFLYYVHPVYADFRAAFAWMFDAGPAFFATIACTAFFLMLRFSIKSLQKPSKTRFRHVVAAMLVSLAGVVSWEVAQFVLSEQAGFRSGSLLGSFFGSFVIILLWLFIRLRVKEKEEAPYSSHI